MGQADVARPIAKAAGNLDAEAATVVARLENSAEGCDWLIEQWRSLEATVRRAGYLREDLLKRAAKLLGVEGDPALEEDPAISALWGAGMAAIPTIDMEAVLAPTGLQCAGQRPPVGAEPGGQGVE